MKTYETLCLGCGEPIVFTFYEEGELVDDKLVTWEESGWWDHVCTNCEWFSSYCTVENIVSKNLDAFVVKIQDLGHLLIFLKVLRHEHLELFKEEK